MKKIFNSFLLKRILFNFDYIVAMFLPFILTILAAVPLYGNKDIEPFGWPLLLIQIFWVGFIFIGIRNTFPKEDDDSRNFIPFINILATLPPLNLLIFPSFGIVRSLNRKATLAENNYGWVMFYGTMSLWFVLPAILSLIANFLT